MFIGFRLTAFSGSPRKSLLSTERFYFFDAAYAMPPPNCPWKRQPSGRTPGPVFEQWVGIELWKRLQYVGGRLHYVQTKAGAEVDFIIARRGRFTPIEVKWTERSTQSDARHVVTFLEEQPKGARHGYLICRCPVPLALSNRVTALPWTCL